MKTINSSILFERSFKHNAEYNGDKQPKSDAATAKRVATALRTAANNYRFESLLEPEQLLALKAAANVMTDLANGLDEVCILSKRHFKKCEADRQLKAVQHKAQREAVLDAAASNRWTDDVHMRAEADDLATFFDDRQRSVSRWLGSRRGTDGASMSSMSLPEVDVGDGYRHCYDACQLLAACKAAQSATATIALRRYAASMVDALATQTQRTYVFNDGKTLSYPLLSDFEAWRTEQADRRRSVALSVGSFSSTSPT